MQIDHRSYRANSFLPRPTIFNNEEQKTMIIVTPWGDPSIAHKVNDEVINYLSAASSDVDITSPFDFYESQSSTCNYLRIGLLLANDAIYRSENKSEYTAGFEVLVMSKIGSQLAWAAVGQPNMLLQKPNNLLVPINNSIDLSFEESSAQSSLPSEMLGVAPLCHVNCGQFRIDPQDSLLVFSGIQLPAEIWLAESQANLQNCTNTIVNSGFNQSFWIGKINFDDEA